MPVFTWLVLVRTAGAENAGSMRTGKPGNDVPSWRKTYTSPSMLAYTISGKPS